MDDPTDDGARLHAELLRRGLTVACAESLTGGEVAARLSATPGASATFVGGVVCYATSVKVDLLGVSEQTVSDQGVVSAACARELAAGVRRVLRADWAVSTTGVAGPDAQEGKPVGLVYVGVAGPDGVVAHELRLVGDRAVIRATAADTAVTALLAALTHPCPAPVVQ